MNKVGHWLKTHRTRIQAILLCMFSIFIISTLVLSLLSSLSNQAMTEYIYVLFIMAVASFGFLVTHGLGTR